MTFIQPNKNSSSLSKILIILTMCLVLCAFWLIVLYNRLVNLNHGLLQMKAEFQDVQAKNSEIESNIFNLIGGQDQKSAAGKFVQEKNPEYLEINSKWSYASGH